ncbi:MAG: hypothetical protein WCW14_04455 [Candidatus Paceibacterota bacterium]
MRIVEDHLGLQFDFGDLEKDIRMVLDTSEFDKVIDNLNKLSRQYYTTFVAERLHGCEWAIVSMEIGEIIGFLMDTEKGDFFEILDQESEKRGNADFISLMFGLLALSYQAKLISADDYDKIASLVRV